MWESKFNLVSLIYKYWPFGEHTEHIYLSVKSRLCTVSNKCLRSEVRGGGACRCFGLCGLLGERWGSGRGSVLCSFPSACSFDCILIAVYVISTFTPYRTMEINLATWKCKGGSIPGRFFHKGSWNVPKNDKANENGIVWDLIPCLDIIHKPPSTLFAKKALGGICGECQQRGLTEAVYPSINTDKYCQADQSSDFTFVPF